MSTTKVKMDRNYFIKKFKAIPNSKWCTWAFDYKGKKCVLAHCGMNDHNYHKTIPEVEALKGVLKLNIFQIAALNNGNTTSTKLKTPRGRVLEALKKTN